MLPPFLASIMLTLFCFEGWNNILSYLNNGWQNNQLIEWPRVQKLLFHAAFGRIQFGLHSRRSTCRTIIRRHDNEHIDTKHNDTCHNDARDLVSLCGVSLCWVSWPHSKRKQHVRLYNGATTLNASTLSMMTLSLTLCILTLTIMMLSKLRHYAECH